MKNSLSWKLVAFSFTSSALLLASAAQAHPTSSIHGHVTNALDGIALENVAVTFHTATASAGTVFTNATGDFDSGAIPVGDYLVDFALSGFTPLTHVAVTAAVGAPGVANESLSPILSGGQFRFVVTWTDEMVGAVRDVDSYLLTPDGTRPYYYANLGSSSTPANVDHDDTQWTGPETTTISTLNPVGTYIFYVNNYNDRVDTAALGNSHVHIVVYMGAQVLRQYDIPAGTGITWEAFRIVDGVFDDSQSKRYNDSLWVSGMGI